MPSLNEYAARLSHVVGKPFDHILNERIKSAIRSLYAQRIRQSVEKYGVDDEYRIHYDALLMVVDKADSCYVDIDCDVLRTVNTVPKPVRFRKDSPFAFVGSLRWIAFTFLSSPSLLKFMKRLRFIGDNVLFSYLNGYIYIYNARRIKWIRIRDIFSNPAEAISYCNSTDCISDDNEYPAPDDMIQSILTELLKTEFGISKPMDIESKIEEE